MSKIEKQMVAAMIIMVIGTAVLVTYVANSQTGQQVGRIMSKGLDSLEKSLDKE